MKLKKRFSVVLTIAALALITANVASAQGPTNFSMVGLIKGETLQINLLSFSPNPCSTNLVQGFQNSSGVPVGPTLTVTPQQLPSGHATSLAYSPIIASERRLELLPTLVASPPGPTGTGCIASVEVTAAGASSVLIPGSVSYPPTPAFATVELAPGRTVRLNAVAFPPNPCAGVLSFTDVNGSPVGSSLQVSLVDGQATFLELPGSIATGEVRPVVTVTDGACIASAELYANESKDTAVYYPPTPCAPTDTSCVAF